MWSIQNLTNRYAKELKVSKLPTRHFKKHLSQNGPTKVLIAQQWLMKITPLRTSSLTGKNIEVDPESLSKRVRECVIKGVAFTVHDMSILKWVSWVRNVQWRKKRVTKEWKRSVPTCRVGAPSTIKLCSTSRCGSGQWTNRGEGSQSGTATERLACEQSGMKSSAYCTCT